VYCALGWARWKTYVGRPETDVVRIMAMGTVGNGLCAADRHEDALIVKEAELATLRRLGVSESNILTVQSNLANSYQMLGRHEQALQMRRDVYSGRLRLNGEENISTLRAANNYAASLKDLQRFEEAKSVFRKMIPVARRVLGESHINTLQMESNYAIALYRDDGTTLDDLREAVDTLEDTDRIARRVLGGEHPLTADVGVTLRDARALLSARETPPTSNNA
jgi:tetratricopeptide (TPR) repeat protein